MRFYDPLTVLKGVGPKKLEALDKLGLSTVGDLLRHYPRSYEDRSCRKMIGQLTEGETALVRGRIALMVKGFRRGRRGANLKLLVEGEDGAGLEVVFFQGSFLEKSLNKEDLYEFYGKVSSRGGRLQMLQPSFNKAAENGETPGILPVYPLAEGLSQGHMRSFVRQALSALSEEEEYLPEPLRRREGLCGLEYALRNVHFPEEAAMRRAARYRLAFEEFFFLELGILAVQRQKTTGARGIAFSKDVSMDPYIRDLPFPLTGAQKRVLGEIERDMESPAPMNRLVQGDVGSGKTAVAAAAVYKAVKSGYQAVLMAPTELLAKQHFAGLSADFAPLGVSCDCLLGSQTAAEKKRVLARLASGETDLLIGTHALIQPGVGFARLGLVITDEQHRFGVRQRSLLSEKAENPDVLVMTATPIPRTLAVVLYGDLDISSIDELPPGRKPIRTKALGEKERDKAYQLLERELEKGRQAYVVAPLIDDSEAVECRSATGLYEELKEKYPQYSVGLLHGAMKGSEKEAVMARFYGGDVQILVSTVVIEVGINVPNATVMILESAQRFGLAQMHQLRGRVGRGADQSYCLLVLGGSGEIAMQRAEIMESSSDGFVIAEEDLKLRGPGEFFGLRQHGMLDFKIADPVKHGQILARAKQAAEELLAEDSFLTAPAHQLLRERLTGSGVNWEKPIL